jgi:DNA-binding CsgD family transcriptional regulator
VVGRSSPAPVAGPGGRDDLLALADRRLAAAAAGQGHLLFVAGEAGIGKTRLLAAVASGRPAAPWSPLTAREFEVARLVAAGNTNRQIPAELFLSPKTVSAHVEHILAKLGAARRTEIAAWVTGVARSADGSGR